MVSAGSAGFTVKFRDLESDKLDESVTFAVKSYAPAAVGVPDNTPPGDKLRPGARDPLRIDHEKGGVPAVADNVCE